MLEDTGKVPNPNLWFIADEGANSVVEVTPEGLILADTKNPGAEIEAALIAEIKSISPMPVKCVRTSSVSSLTH